MQNRVGLPYIGVVSAIKALSFGNKKGLGEEGETGIFHLLP